MLVRFGLACLTSLPAHVFAAIYYVDSSAGNDNNSGLESGSAWRSLAKVNETIFSDGDDLLFKRGGAWSGQLSPKGAGKMGRPIRIDSYGDGAKPLINGEATNAAVYLVDQSHWEIRNLEVTNTGPTAGERVGILIRNSGKKGENHIYIGSCDVHDVNGVTAGYYGKNAGIAVVSDMNGSYWNNVMIENNTVKHVDRMGIFVGPTAQTGTPNDWILLPRSNNITIQNNAVTDSGGDGILVFVTNNTLIQHNVIADCGGRAADGGPNETDYTNKYSAGIWTAVATRTVIQYNEVYGEKTTFDGQGFDIDLGSDDVVLQFNYSHHNLGGFLLICESGSKADINNARVRFNITHDDRRAIFVICGAGLSPAPDAIHILNNTIFVPRGSRTPMFLYSKNLLKGPMRVYNNIFYVLGTTDYCQFEGATFENNTFFGHHPETEPPDAYKLTSDPMLVAPGSAGAGFHTLDGYMLRSDSPGLRSGRYTDGEKMGVIDLWGNRVDPAFRPNRGAYNGDGIPGIPPNYAFNANLIASSSHEADGWGVYKLVDGQQASIPETRGYSSALGKKSDHTVSIEIDMGRKHKIPKIILCPAAASGHREFGFPKSFQIQAWDGSNWKTCVDRTDFEIKEPIPQLFDMESPVSTDRIRIVCTKLGRAGDDYAVQLAEVIIQP